MVDSPYNITFYAQEDHWKDNIKLGMNGNIKTLLSGTIILPYNKGSLYKKSGLSLTLNQLKEILLKLKDEKVKFYKFEFSNNHLIVMNFDLIKNDYKNLKKLYNLSTSNFIENFLNIYKLNYNNKDNYENKDNYNKKDYYDNIIKSVIDRNYDAKDLFKIKKLLKSNVINKGYIYLKE